MIPCRDGDGAKQMETSLGKDKQKAVTFYKRSPAHLRLGIRESIKAYSKEKSIFMLADAIIDTS